MFTELENNKPFVKMAFNGFAGDGKSYTAAMVAIGIHKLIKSTKPIAVFDTERAYKNLKPTFDQDNIKVVTTQERSLASLNKAIQWASAGNTDILIIDSITHVYENFIEAYKNEKRRVQMQFQDWGIVKPKWKKEFSDPFVLANCHIIFTGRAGFEYETEVDEQTGKKEIYKSGIKMKAENETAFEPDILVLMEKVQKVLDDKKEVYRIGTVIKDRTTIIDGKSFKNPSFKDFLPAISQMLSGTLKELSSQSTPDTFDDIEDKFNTQNKQRKEAIAEIEGHFELMGLGTSKDDKQLKAAILNKVFKCTSIEKVENLRLMDVKKGASIIKSYASYYIDYLGDCASKGIKPEMATLSSMLDDVIEEVNNDVMSAES